MNINELMEIVHGAYPDRFTAMYWDERNQKPQNNSGDTLAQFIVNEIFETFEPEASKRGQILTASIALMKARENLQEVEQALDAIGETL